MRSNILNAVIKTALVAGVLLGAGISSAATINLRAVSGTNTDADGATVWRFVCDADNVEGACVSTDESAPTIRVSSTEALTINLANELPVPVSIMIPGQFGDTTISRTGDGRALSLAAETAAGSAGSPGTNVYNWSTLNEGTYLFQSATVPQLQVPMGLFGALVVTGPNYPAAGQEAVLLFSEIDPIQNDRVHAAASAGPLTEACVSMADFLDPMTPSEGYPCTIDYSPTYYLVNGKAAPNLSGLSYDPLATEEANTVHLRMLNAGLRTHTPAFVNLEMSIFAEDGNIYPGQPLQQSGAMLAAGKTLDALMLLPAVEDLTIAMNDRSPSFSDDNYPTGGARAALVVGDGSGPGTEANTGEFSEDVDEDTPLQWDPPGGNGLRIVSGAAHGTIETVDNGGTLNFLYTPHLDFFGTDAFTYYQPGNAKTWYVTLNVAPVNDIPVGTADAYSNTFGSDILVAAPGVLGNDIDVDGDTLTASLVDPVPGLTLGSDGSIEYTGTDPVTFAYVVNDGTADSTVDGADPITVTLNSNPVSDIVLNVQEPDGTPVPEYRWLVQEDAGYAVNPAEPAPFLEQQSLNFHKSYMPVIAQGCTGCTPDVDVAPFDDPAVADDFPGEGDIDFNGNGMVDDKIDIAELALDPTKRYYVSVLPNDAGTGQGHTIGGTQIPALADATAGYAPVTVIVNPHEIPTAQVSVYVFEDHVPTNGVPDASEPGLGGFTVTLEDAGGRYGMSGGPMSQDAFGAPLTNSLLGEPGCPGTAPPGIIVSCPDGSVLIKDLPPGKYGVVVTPPADAQQWIQTSTIEGSPVIDAWVKAGEPTFFAEFGLPGPHVFVGYVDPNRTVLPPNIEAGPNTITGSVTLLHDPRPPGAPGTSDSGSYAGLSHTSAWIGLNTVAGDGANVATVQAAEDGSFSIEGIPNGDYQLVIWDTYLDQIIAFQSVTLTGGGATVGNVPVNNWFARVENNVFLDANGNGVWDGRGENPDEPGIPEQAVNLRWRDGTMNQAFPTDSDGFVPFDEVFPFFHWQLLEIDYTRFKPTGMTATVDAGGTVDADGPFAGLLRSTYPTGTLQVEDGDGAWGAASTRRTELGSTVLVQAFQGFPGQTSVIDWGKVPYQPGENGGISGIVSYGSTRGEADPRLTVMDPWEPGVPGVTVNLYREVPGDVAGETKLALIQSVTTDSWDASLPTGCEGEVVSGDPFVDETLGAANADRCYDGWRNWNQVRPGVFDGGYAFNDIPPGNYVVEVVPPPGYEIYKEEDVNVGYGDAYGNPPTTGFEPVSVILPNGALVYALPDMATVESVGLIPGLAQPKCVGPARIVPAELSLFPGDAAPFAGAIRPLCTRKEVLLSDQGQSAADFHLLTQTPVAAQFTGLITDDIAAQTDPASPGFGEKFSPSYLPIAVRDFTGREVYRGYSDAFGHYNGVLPSTYTANAPIPSGYAPAMMSACLNDGGNGPSLDPLVNPSYGGACYTMQFMPGTTTYLDTPVLPQAAFAAGYNSPDCAAPQGTPVIVSVSNDDGSLGPFVAPNDTILIESAGDSAEVPNPAYEGPLAAAPYNAPTITRDLGFGPGGGPNRGIVEIVEADGTRHLLETLNGGNGWNPNRIRAKAPNAPITGTLVVTRGDGSQSVNGVTITVGTETPIRVGPGQSIQAAIDGAAPGALILVAPGVYEESVVMWKPVRLQGSGSSTIINAVSRPTDKLEAWQNKVEGLVADNLVSLLPGQPTAGTPFAPGLLGSERGAGVTVLARGGPGSGCGSATPGDGCFQVAGGERKDSRIDGFTITGGASGGGIFVNGYAHGLEIANNSVTANTGAYHGGIRVGHPYLLLDAPAANGLFGFNNGIRIHNNAVTRNGATGEQSAGGGISLMTGTNGYRVENNFVCGNFAQGDGGGIAHLGLSNAGRIQNNDILFNESSNPGLTQSGGGLFIAGEQPAPPTVPGDQPELLSRGAGNVIVNANRIQGNHAASGHGGGIRAERINGLDVVGATVNQRYRLLLDNNIVVNNVAGWSGGGVSLLDSARVIMRNNTIANNDTTATVGSLLPTPSDVSVAQPAGISSQQHSLVLAAALATTVDPQTFSSPFMINNIVWHNRAFNYDGNQAVHLQPELAPTTVGECATGANYIDLGVLGGAGQLDPRRSILTDTTGYHGSNIDGDPLFVGEYCNGGRKLSVAGPMEASAAQGEGGNFVTVRYGALTQAWSEANGPADPGTEAAPWDYHIGVGSAAEDTAAGGPGTDFDGDSRPQGAGVDRGADELVP